MDVISFKQLVISKNIRFIPHQNAQFVAVMLDITWTLSLEMKSQLTLVALVIVGGLLIVRSLWKMLQSALNTCLNMNEMRFLGIYKAGKNEEYYLVYLANATEHFRLIGDFIHSCKSGKLHF